MKVTFLDYSKYSKNLEGQEEAKCQLTHTAPLYWEWAPCPEPL